MTILIGDVSKAERCGYERGLRYALKLLDDVEKIIPGGSDRSRLEAHAAGIRYLIFHEMRTRLEAERDGH